MRFSSVIKSSQGEGFCSESHCSRVIKSSFRSKKREQRIVRRCRGITGLQFSNLVSICALASLMICVLTVSVGENGGDEDVAMAASFCIDLTRSIFINENVMDVQPALEEGSSVIPGERSASSILRGRLTSDISFRPLVFSRP